MLPVTFGALDGEARWRAEEGVEVGPHRLAAPYPNETTRPALFTALRTGFAEALLREAFVGIRDLRARRRQERGLAPGETAPGLGKLLVVAPDQENAKRYLETVRRWIPRHQAEQVAQLATSDMPRAHEAVAAFRFSRTPILVTVAMAYEGLDVPEVAVVAALTHIRSRPWLEQMVARATRVTPMPGLTRRSAPWSSTPTTRCSSASGSAWKPSRARLRAAQTARPASPLPFWVMEELAAKDGIVPLESNALALRFTTLRPGPDLAMRRPEQQETQSELLEPPSIIERRLRARIGELVAAQAVEDEAGRSGLRAGIADRGSITATTPC